MKKITLILTLAITIVFSSSSVFSETTMDLYNQVADISSHKSCKTQLIESFKGLPIGEISKKADPFYTYPDYYYWKDPNPNAIKITCEMQKLPCLTFKDLEYCTIMSPDTGRFWLDRNLGATQSCISSTDTECYGNLYQFGRNDDGHEDRTNASTSTTLATDIADAGTTLFIKGSDWASVDSDGALRTAAWKDGGSNDICPAGFNVPTEAELKADTIDATTTKVTNGVKAFSSFLKLPASVGFRNGQSGLLGNSLDNASFIWSRTASSGSKSRYLHISNSTVDVYSNERASGFSVRCIRN